MYLSDYKYEKITNKPLLYTITTYLSSSFSRGGRNNKGKYSYTSISTLKVLLILIRFSSC